MGAEALPVAIQYFAEYLLYVFITSQLFLCGSPQKNVGALFAIQVHNKAFLKATNCISQDKSSSTAFILKRKIYISFILF